jgi:hypothetical protein
MAKSIYLINPREEYPAYDGTEVLQAWGISNRTSMPDLTMPTVAALIPAAWEIAICDERIEPVDLDTTATFVAITGKSSQRSRCIELASEFRRRGKVVLIGGPFASLEPDTMRPHADILARGEIEDIAAQLFQDLGDGTWKGEYIGGKPDLSISPVPRWDLTRKGTAFIGQVQTSRGCPFECEFCDVIQYLGRKQRWKEPDQVVRELDVLYARGYRGVFFADDNLTVVRRRARALLQRLKEWNESRPAGRVNFSTQVSIDIARDPELLQLCKEARFKSVFIGVETSNEESLAESLKRQNLRVDLAQEVGKVAEKGILVSCGMIVGFDHDDVNIFERQAAFISRLPTPLIQMNVLVAPMATPLYARLLQDGRIISDDRRHTGTFLETNIRPKLMSSQQLKAGATWLVNTIYAPSAFMDRLEAFAALNPVEDAPPPGRMKVIPRALATRLSTYGHDERAMLERMDGLRQRRPDLSGHFDRALAYYCQARHIFQMSGIWNPALASERPQLAA